MIIQRHVGLSFQRGLEDKCRRIQRTMLPTQIHQLRDFTIARV